MSKTYDCCIIGGGPGGYVAAIRASQLGLRTALIEREALGGICLNWGCIPTKALLRSAEVLSLIRRSKEYGIDLKGEIEGNLEAIVARSRKVSERLNKGVTMLLKKNKVDVISGEARLAPQKGRVIIKGKEAEETLDAKHIVIATGASPLSLPGLSMEHPLVWDYRQAMVPKTLPKRLIVIGAGAIGVEFASFYHTLGSQVTLVEALPQILPSEDEEIAKLLEKELTRQGIKVLTNHRYESATLDKSSVTIQIKQDERLSQLQAEAVIVSIGVKGNVAGLNLEHHGVKIDRSIIQTTGLGRSHTAGIYAIGDVSGPPMLAHKAEHEGVACIEAIAGLSSAHDINKQAIPGCTYCHPQVASVGMSEAQAKQWAKEKNMAIKIGRFPFAGNGKAVALGETSGLIKTIFANQTGELLGAHMIGAEVTELIQGYVIAKQLETTEEDLKRTIFPHPTLSEMMHESVLAADEQAIHI